MLENKLAVPSRAAEPNYANFFRVNHPICCKFRNSTIPNINVKSCFPYPIGIPFRSICDLVFRCLRSIANQIHHPCVRDRLGSERRVMILAAVAYKLAIRWLGLNNQWISFASNRQLGKKLAMRFSTHTY